MLSPSTVGRQVAFGAGAFLLADLITGMAAYSVITLSSLWYFSWSWVRLVGEFAAQGQTFGSPWQLQLAYVGEFGLLPIAGAVIYLAFRAYRLPVALARRIRDPGGATRSTVGGVPADLA